MDQELNETGRLQAAMVCYAVYIYFVSRSTCCPFFGEGLRKILGFLGCKLVKLCCL
jgi:hypothetical protein